MYLVQPYIKETCSRKQKGSNCKGEGLLVWNRKYIYIYITAALFQNYGVNLEKEGWSVLRRECNERFEQKIEGSKNLDKW